MNEPLSKFIDYSDKTVFVRIDMESVKRMCETDYGLMTGAYRQLYSQPLTEQERKAGYIGFYYKYLPEYLRCHNCDEIFSYSEHLEVIVQDVPLHCRCPFCKDPYSCYFSLEQPDVDIFELTLRMKGE